MPSRAVSKKDAPRHSRKQRQLGMKTVEETCHRCGGWVWHRRSPCDCKPVNIKRLTGKDFLAAIAGRLRATRKNRKLSLDELAARASISKTGLWQIEMARSEPMASTIVALASALDVTTDYLLGMADWPKNGPSNAGHLHTSKG